MCRPSLVPSLPRLRDISNGLRQAGEAAGPPGTIVAGAGESHNYRGQDWRAGGLSKVSPDCIHIFIGIGSSQFEVLGVGLNELGASPGGETQLSDWGISVVDESCVLEFVYSHELSC